MSYLKIKDFNSACYFNVFEHKFLVFKLLLKNSYFLKKYLHFFFFFFSFDFLLFFSFVKMSNRCIVSNSGRGLLYKYKISRIVFSDLCSNGFLNGFYKSSW